MLPPGSIWFCLIRSWSALRKELFDERSRTPAQKCELQPFLFQKVPMWYRLLVSQLGGSEYNSRYLKSFFKKLPRKLRSAFLLKLIFLKIRLLVTWPKCLYIYVLYNAFLIMLIFYPSTLWTNHERSNICKN